MKITINRFKKIHDGTIGKLEAEQDGQKIFSCFTLEPAGGDTTERGKDRRIPAGLYNVEWHNSPSQRRICPLLWNESVPKSRYILIHTGNFPKDTAGCILVGDGHSAAGVTNSLKTYNALFKLAQKHGLQSVEIVNGAGV